MDRSKDMAATAGPGHSYPCIVMMEEDYYQGP